MNKNYKVFFGFFVLIVLGVIIYNIFDFGSSKHILKSEYSMGEVGYLDNIEITLKSASYINNGSGILVSFEITNETKNTITINPDQYFKFYDVNQVQIPNKYSNNTNIVKKGDTINYKLQYDVTKKELYEIYFYSQIVENNVKFSFRSSDINSLN